MHDWRKGAAFFEQYLLDIDTASNNGGWQWSASTGVDPKPLRIFNPTLQAERFDPTGAYIRTHVPELARVPDAYVHAPWTMPPLVQREARCIIGEDYPRPIVDHHEASARFKAAYLDLKRRA
jgi:deoxyribodipyrimidine photo-lyase